MCDRILILDADSTLRESLELALGCDTAAVVQADSAEAAIDILGRTPFDVVFCAAKLAGVDDFDVLPQIHRVQPETPVILTGPAPSHVLAEEALRRGAWGALAYPADPPSARLVLARALSQAQLRRLTAVLQADVSRTLGERPIVAASDGMIELLEMLDRAAGYKSTVLITGEPGTGKEGIARALHAQSPRRDAPFVVFDCGSVPADRVDAALFGHAGGTNEPNAPARRGHFADADRGTLLLERIDLLPAPTQVALLHAIQSEEIEPVGDAKPLPVDVRVVAAAHVDLEAEVAAGRFRRDLFDRLDVVRMQVPPLRERREDLALLVDHHLTRAQNRYGQSVRRVEDETLERLLAYAWPGNVRELELVIERAALAVGGDTLEPGSLPPEIGPADAPYDPRADAAGTVDEREFRLKPARQAFEARHILRALERTGGNRTHAARLLGISHRALLYKIKDYGLRD